MLDRFLNSNPRPKWIFASDNFVVSFRNRLTGGTLGRIIQANNLDRL